MRYEPIKTTPVTLDDMITTLERFRKKYGNMPVGFWEGTLIDFKLMPCKDGVKTYESQGEEPTELIIEAMCDSN